MALLLPTNWPLHSSGKYTHSMKRIASLLFFLFPMVIVAQGDISQRSDPHYSTDSAYFCLDTLDTQIPLKDVKKKLEQALNAGGGIAWNKSEVAAHGSVYSGRVEFLYEPDSLLEVQRMGYLSAYAEIRLVGNHCIIKLQLWVHQTVVSSMNSRSIGPISRGSRCSKNLCAMLGVPKCSEICELELWPALQKARTEYVAWLKSGLAQK